MVAFVAQGTSTGSGARPRLRAAAGVAAGALVVATLVVMGANANGIAWALVQVLWTTLAVIDLEQRRVPNVITAPAAIAMLGLRLAFARDNVIESLVAAAGIGAVFLLFAVVARGGFGMGDVKLAALIGLALGRVAVSAVFVGVLAGSVASLVVFLRTRSRRSTLAYAPYLCAGAAVTTLFATVPSLV